MHLDTSDIQSIARELNHRGPTEAIIPVMHPGNPASHYSFYLFVQRKTPLAYLLGMSAKGGKSVWVPRSVSGILTTSVFFPVRVSLPKWLALKVRTALV